MRISTIDAEAMTPEQKRTADEATSGKRGRMPAPLGAWIHSPEFGARAQRLGEFLRYETSLGPALSELAILVTARHWTSHYEWFVHKREAQKAGLDPAVIAAIAERRKPAFADPRAAAVYDYATALIETHAVPQPIHEAAVAALGEAGTVELVGVLGYYALVSMTLNAFEIGLREGEVQELAP